MTNTDDLTPEQQDVFNRAYRVSLGRGNSGWDSMIDAQRELAAFMEIQAEDREESRS